MTKSLVFRLAVTGLAFAVGFGLAYGVMQVSNQSVSDPVDLGVTDTPLPDPLARTSRPASSLLLVVLLFAIAAGVLWLGRRRALGPEEEEVPQVRGPHLIFERDAKGRKRSPDFYEDLRQRETRLESLEGQGPERRPRKVIELPVGDRQPMNCDRQSSS